MMHTLLKTTADNLRGHLLIAMPRLNDGYFSHTVTYLCEHNADGAMGLVINQPIDLTLGQMLQQLDITPTTDLGAQRIFRGGPVQPDNGFVLHTAGTAWTGTRSLCDGLALTTSRDILEAMAAGRGPQQSLIALGYAGWGPQQLEEELAENAWIIAPAQPSLLFSTPPERRWNAAAHLIGIDVNLISQEAGHA
jgi:putative transcriptional regulator